MNIYETKNRLNYRITPHTQTPRMGEGAYSIILIVSEDNLFGLHKIAWCPWQPIRHCSWVICKQAQDRHMRVAPIFMDIFSLPLIQEKQAVSYWRNKMVAK